MLHGDFVVPPIEKVITLSAPDYVISRYYKISSSPCIYKRFLTLTGAAVTFQHKAVITLTS